MLNLMLLAFVLLAKVPVAVGLIETEAISVVEVKVRVLGFEDWEVASVSNSLKCTGTIRFEKRIKANMQATKKATLILSYFFR